MAIQVQLNGVFQTVTKQQLFGLAARGKIGPMTPIEVDGKRATAGKVKGLVFGEAVPVSDVPSPPLQTARTVSAPMEHYQDSAAVSDNATTVKKIKTYFKMYQSCLEVGMLLGVLGSVLLVILGVLGYMARNDAVEMVFVGGCLVFTILSIPFFLLSMVSMYMLLYQLWKVIPTDLARTTPGKAVGFNFIPFFNLYWMFVAYEGLGADMNKALVRRRIPYKVNLSLGLTYCMLVLIACFAFVSWVLIALVIMLIAPVIILVQFYFFRSAKNGAVLMLEQGGLHSEPLPDVLQTPVTVSYNRGDSPQGTVKKQPVLLGFAIALIGVCVFIGMCILIGGGLYIYSSAGAETAETRRKAISVYDGIEVGRSTASTVKSRLDSIPGGGYVSEFNNDDARFGQSRIIKWQSDTMSIMVMCSQNHRKELIADSKSKEGF